MGPGTPPVSGVRDPGPYGPQGRSAWLDVDWREHQRWVEVEGRPVNVIDLGEGPPVVFVHGLSGVWQNWLETLPDIARDHRAIALDLPGFGRSPMPAGPISITGYARLLGGLLDALDLPSATLVGNSMGGFVAADLAIQEPARVDRLALVAAAGISVEQMRNDRGLALLRRLETLVELYGAFVASRVDAVTRRRRLRRAMLRVVMAEPESLPGPLIREQLEGTGAPGFLDAVEALTTYPIRDRLPEIAVPTLVVWGAEDRLVPLADAHRFAELIPDTELVVYPRTGHVPMLERPQRFLEDLSAFLTR